MIYCPACKDAEVTYQGEVCQLCREAIDNNDDVWVREVDRLNAVKAIAEDDKRRKAA